MGCFQESTLKDYLCLFQNSLLREVENAKKQLEETQHDKVCTPLSHLEARSELSRGEFIVTVITGDAGQKPRVSPALRRGHGCKAPSASVDLERGGVYGSEL